MGKYENITDWTALYMYLSRHFVFSLLGFLIYNFIILKFRMDVRQFQAETTILVGPICNRVHVGWQNVFGSTKNHDKSSLQPIFTSVKVYTVKNQQTVGSWTTKCQSHVN